jgi:DNA-binding XRE family transcriptional regulator
MPRNFKELQARMPRRARVRSERAAKKMISEMGLAQLRAAMDLTQESLADTLNVKQASISKMERRSDMYISTLSKVIEAMGGELQIIAKMPNGKVEIRQFTKIRGKSAAPPAPRRGRRSDGGHLRAINLP